MGEEMEANTCYLGIELNDSYAMVSYMHAACPTQKCRHVVLWGRCRKDGKNQ